MREELKVPAEKLKFICNPDNFTFSDTSEVEPLKDFVGQKRAIEALRLGLEMESPGYNIFATGLANTGRNAVIREHLKRFAEEKKAKVILHDFCYIHNFDNPDQPMILIFEKGKGKKFQKTMEEAQRALKKEISNLLQSDEYLKARDATKGEFEEEQNRINDALQKKLDETNFLLVPSQVGLLIEPKSMRPSEDNKARIMSPEEYKSLPEESQKIIEGNRKKLSRLLEKVILKNQQLQKDIEKKIDELEERLVKEILESVFDSISREYQPVLGENEEKDAGYPEVLKFFDGLKDFILKNIDIFRPQDNGANGQADMISQLLVQQNQNGKNPFLPFEVNLLVDNSQNDTPPIIIENQPTFMSLFGKIGKKFNQGAYFIDHTMIKPGSLCLADGGYLVVNALDLLRGGLWLKLEKSLKSGLLKIEDTLEYMGYVSAALNPEPVPINVKVIVIGEPVIYHLLIENDDDFPTVFKVKAEFDSRMELSPENLEAYAGFVSFCCQKEELLPFDRTGIAKVVEYGVRLVDDQNKLSTQFGKIKNLIVEANYWAKKDFEARKAKGEEVVEKAVRGEHVQKAIDSKRRRFNLSEERMREFITEGTILIDIQGEKVGQINGLAVYSTGDYAFGMPSRITAETFFGKMGVVSIDREVKMAGPIHNKGVLILSGYFRRKYGKDKPIAFSASLCFEQSYDGIEGDSASAAELIALISSLAELPIKQNFAITGSVNQKGEIQPIGGANQKVEGFFDVCDAKGLTGEQGVVIPQQNVKNLMLREDVVKAVTDGKFHVYAIKTIDEGIEILTGKSAEEVHTLVNENLKRMIDLLGPQKGSDEEDNSGARDTGPCERCGR